MKQPSLREQYKKLTQRFRKDKKGSLAIEVVIGCFVFLIVLCFLTDITLLGWRFSVVSQTNSYIARTVGLQGGALSSAPDGFPGGGGAYITKNQLMANIAANFEKAGIKSDEYTITVNGTNLSSGVEADYRKELNIETKVKYKWAMVSNFIPGDIENWISSKRSVTSEFKYRYDTWVGE
ncbi:TadE/TadG family type IV pilus assembly protein [Brevibacillus sp. NPDC058079]|uniref:TadE/TadG family type IV pilus assembly protein n=1 Tax=Brevibacillus sp. NPDC058079 TaxID=3346330 RepID=UPI0036ED20C8